MARRPRPTDDDISLFPFLSIIASVIGVLTMMIATLALAQTDNPDVERIEEFETTAAAIKVIDDNIAELQREVSVSSSSVIEFRENKQLLDITVEELQTLLADVERIDQELAEQEKVEVVIPKLNKQDVERVADMRSEQDVLEAQLAQLEKELKERTDVSTEAEVTVLPQGSGLNFKPRFVECDQGSVVMHTTDPPVRIRSADIVRDPKFIELLGEVLNSQNESLIFMVRSDGLRSYNACKKLCDEREIRNGKIPVVGKGRIDLGAFIQQ